MSSFRKLATSYSHFFTGGMLNLMLGFITFPVLTRILTKEEYGIVGLVSTTIFFAMAFAKGGLSEGIIRNYETYSGTAEKRLRFASTIAFRGIIMAAVTAFLYLLIFPEVSKYLHISREYLVCFMIMSGSLLLGSLNAIFMNLMRASGKTLFFNGILFFGKLMSFCISILFFVYLIREFYGYFVGLVLSDLLLSFFLFYWFLANYKIAFSKVSANLAKELMKFGFPLLLADLAFLLLSYADRYMIIRYKGEGALGLYSVGYNIPSYISNLITYSLSYAVIPVYVKIYEREGRIKTEEFLQKCMQYLLIVLIPVFGGYYAVSRDLFVTLASEKFVEAATFSPIILLGALFLGMNHVLSAGLYLEKKSRLTLFINLAGITTNISLNIFLIPQYGVTGAAIATLLSCVIAMVLTVSMSFKFLVVKIDIKDIIYYVFFTYLMYLIVIRIHITAIWFDLIVKIITGVFVMISATLWREKDIYIKIMSFFPLRKYNKSTK